MQGHESDEVRSLREVKAKAEVELEDARAVVEQADADISRAEAQFATGKIPESTLDVRSPRLRDCAAFMLCADAPSVFSQEVLNAKDAAQDALQDAEGKYDAACVALKAALVEAAARQESRKCVSYRTHVMGGLTFFRITSQTLFAPGAIRAGAHQCTSGLAPEEDVRRGRGFFGRRRVPRRRPWCECGGSAHARLWRSRRAFQAA